MGCLHLHPEPLGTQEEVEGCWGPGEGEVGSSRCSCLAVVRQLWIIVPPPAYPAA